MGENTIIISKEFLSFDMDIKTITVTDKGQITLPQKFRKKLNIEKGQVLMAIQDDDTILLQTLDEKKYHDLMLHSQRTAQKLWDNEDDKIWDKM